MPAVEHGEHRGVGDARQNVRDVKRRIGERLGEMLIQPRAGFAADERLARRVRSGRGKFGDQLVAVLVMRVELFKQLQVVLAKKLGNLLRGCIGGEVPILNLLLFFVPSALISQSSISLIFDGFTPISFGPTKSLMYDTA